MISLSILYSSYILSLANAPKQQFYPSKLSVGYDAGGLVFSGNVVRSFHGSGIPIVILIAFLNSLPKNQGYQHRIDAVLVFL